MRWEEEQKLVERRLVFPPMPMSCRLSTGPISGRWDRSTSEVEIRHTLATRKLRLVESMAAEGQRKAITARFICRPDVKEGWWPSIKVQVDDLVRRPLIYEGNHRHAAARMLDWAFVLVEPHLWIYRQQDELRDSFEKIVIDRVRDAIKTYSPLVHVPRPSPAVLPKDYRLVEPCRQDLPPFRGVTLDTANDWIAAVGGRDFYGTPGWEGDLIP